MEDWKVPVSDAGSYGTFNSSESGILNCEAVSEKKHQTTVIPAFKVDRPAMSQVCLNNALPPLKNDDTFPDKVQSFYQSNLKCSCVCAANFFKQIFPILRWLPQYSIKNDIIIDIITGFTLLILHVPQGMAYAQLASVEPVYGLYTSFYPVLIYFFLGTSKHLSVGTFAISSLMTGTEVDYVSHLEFLRHKAIEPIQSNVTGNFTGPTYDVPTNLHTKIQIAVVMTFTVGMLQTIMGIIRMGSLTSFMSDEMISAFITGTVLHIFTSQLTALTGGTFKKYSGPFNVMFSWINFFENINTINYIVVLISLCSLIFLILVKEIINGFVQPKIKIPIPAELILVIIGTVISQYLDLNVLYNVDIVGETPTGLNPPEVPHFELMPQLLTSSTILSIVCASTTLSMVLIYAKKYEYEVDTNQELIAYGIGGLVSSFFSCIPICGSLSRTAVQVTTGGKSQIAGLVSCCLMLVVILKLGPLFEHLPDCVLSAVIIVSLKSMLLHFQDLKRAWNASKLDASVWLVTFLSVVILDIDYGLIIGILFSLITILFRSQCPETCLLGNVPGTELYRNADKYPNVAEVPGVKIFHFGASLYFGNRDYFRSQLFHLVSSQQTLKRLTDASYQNLKGTSEKSSSSGIQPTSYEEDLLKVIIIEMSAIAYMDSGGVATLIQVVKEFALNKITLYLACVQEPVLESLNSQGFFKGFGEQFVFPTVHDAVLFANEHNAKRSQY